MQNISLVGAGYWGSKLVKELKTIEGVGEVEIIDIKDGKDLKDIKYDNVILATSAWDHYKQTIKLLEQGKNLYVEKPLALTTEECLDIKSKIKTTGDKSIPPKFGKNLLIGIKNGFVKLYNALTII